MKNNLTILIALLGILEAFAQCPQPTGITHSNVTYYSVVINFPGFGPSTNIVEWGYPGFTPGTGGNAGAGGHIVSFSSASVTVTFNTNSTIEYYVRYYCTSTSTYSPNSVVGSFTPLPCPQLGWFSTGALYSWNFCSRGIVDSYNYNCSPDNYGNEFMGRYPSQLDYSTVNASYHNNTGTPKKFTFLYEWSPIWSWCGPEGLECTDQVTIVAPGGTINRRYIINTTSSAEIWFDCDDTSGCSSVDFTITPTCGTAPSSITASPSNTICQGSPITLTQVGGVLPPGGNYYWYNGNCNSGSLIGTGPSITFTPAGSGNYYVRTEGPCGISYCTSIYIYVSLPVQISYYGSSTLFCYPNSTLTLTASAGYGNNTYQWLLNGNPIAGATNYYYYANAQGNWQCSVVNGCGTTVSNTVTITQSSYPVAVITASGPTSFCNSGSVTLSATTGVGYAYQWTQDGYTISGATNPTYVAVGNHYYRCNVSNNCGTSYSNTITVIVNTSLPNAGAWSNNLNICPSGSSVLNVNNIQGQTYQWRFNTIPISGATNSSYTATAVGNYDCIATNGCGSLTSNTLTVVSNAGTVTISAGGPTTFCNGGSVTLNANTGTGITYQWSRNAAAISGATSSSYVATLSGSYTCQITRCGSTANSNTINVTASTGPPASITSSSTSLCPGGSLTLNANTGTGLTYQWRYNGGVITGATSSSYVATALGSYYCIVTNSCGSTTSNTLTLTAGSTPSAVISMYGSTSFCVGAPDHLMANTALGQSYQWQLNGTSISGATITEYYPTISGSYTCVVTNSCGPSTSNSITITILTAPVVTITAGGPTTFCQGGSVVLTSSTSLGSTYQWKKNAVAISGATNSTYTATTAGSYTVTKVNSCGSVTSSAITVTISGSAPAQPGTISGPSTFCSYQSGVVYTIAPVPSATSYNWLVPNGATITAGQGTTSITVTFGNKNGNIKVAAISLCGMSSYKSKNVNKNCREGEIISTVDLHVIVFPNPGQGPFTLQVSGNDFEKFTFKVFDLTGRCMETYESETGDAMIEFGYALPAGIYIGEIISGEERKLLRIIKQE